MTTKFTYLKAADKKQPHQLNLAVLQPGTYFYVSQANIQKMYDLLRVVGWRGFVDGTTRRNRYVRFYLTEFTGVNTLWTDI